jgi:hypothetical protein
MNQLLFPSVQIRVDQPIMNWHSECLSFLLLSVISYLEALMDAREPRENTLDQLRCCQRCGISHFPSTMVLRISADDGREVMSTRERPVSPPARVAPWQTRQFRAQTATPAPGAIRFAPVWRPRVINVDGRPAYGSAVAELKQTGELDRRCRCRPSHYLNNIIEQDHHLWILTALRISAVPKPCRSRAIARTHKRAASSRLRCHRSSNPQ